MGQPPTRSPAMAMTSSRGRGCHNRNHVVDRKSTRLNSSHSQISYAVFCLKKKKPQPPLPTDLILIDKIPTVTRQPQQYKQAPFPSALYSVIVHRPLFKSPCN